MPAPASTARPSPPSDLAFTCALLLVALLPRLFVALAWSREPVWDGHYYHLGAARIAEGLGYSEDVLRGGVPVWRPWCHYPVGYSGFLALAYRLFGDGIRTAPLANAVVGALLAAVVHRLALRAMTLGRARVAGGIVALHAGLIAYSAVLMSEVLCALLVFTAAWVGTRRATLGAAATAGLLLGLATLVRPASILAAPLAVLLIPAPRRFAVARAVVVVAAALLTVAPWTLRNCRVMDGCAFVSTNFGWNLAIGALTPNGRFHPLRASDGCPVVTGQVQQDRCWAAVGRETIRRDPAAWLARIPAKLSQTYDHESFAIEYLREADPASWSEPRRVAGRALLGGLHQLLLVAALLGGLSLPSRRRLGAVGALVQGVLVLATLGYSLLAFSGDGHPFWPVALAIPLLGLLPLPGSPPRGPVERFALAWVLVTSVTHAVFFGDDRYHLVVTPALALLAAQALRRLGPRTAP